MYMNSMKTLLIFVKFWGFFHFFPKWQGRKFFFHNRKKTVFNMAITAYGRNRPTLQCFSVGISEGCFVFHFVSLPLEVARPIQPTLCTKVAIKHQSSSPSSSQIMIFKTSFQKWPYQNNLEHFCTKTEILVYIVQRILLPSAYIIAHYCRILILSLRLKYHYIVKVTNCGVKNCNIKRFNINQKDYFQIVSTGSPGQIISIKIHLDELKVFY